MRFKSAITVFVLISAAFLDGCSDVSPDELIARAEQAFDNKQFKAAVVDLKTVLQSHPEHARARWLLGELYLEMQDGPSAEKEIRRAASLGVNEDSTAPQLARAMLMQKKLDDVIKLSTKGALSKKSAAEIAAAQAAALLIKKDDQAAGQRLATARQLAPESTYVQYVDALAHLLEKKKQEATDIVLAILKTDPNHGESWTLLGDIYRSDDKLTEAEDAYTKAMSKRFVNIDERLKRAQVRMAMAKFDEAMKDVQELLKQVPKSALVQRIAGVLHFRSKEFQAAEERLSLAYNGDSSDVATLFFLALTESELGNKNRSRQLAEQLVATEPRFVPGRKLLAILQINKGEGALAEALLRPIVNARRQDTEAQQLLATSLLMQGNAGEASEILDALAKHQPSSATAQLSAGVGQIQAGDVDKGIETLTAAAALAPDDPKIVSMVVSNLLQEHALDDALTSAKRFAEAELNSTRALVMLAGVHLARQENEQAASVLNQALGQEPGNAAASVILARIQQAAGEPAKASKTLKAAIDKHPDDLQLIIELAEFATSDSRLEEAVSLLERAINLNPTSLPARLMLAKIYLSTGEPRKVLEILSDDSVPQNEKVLVARADAYYRLNRLADAKRELEQFATLRPDFFEAQFELAKIDAAMGDLESTERHLTAALQIAPDDPRALLARARLLALRGKPDEALQVLDQALPETDVAELEAARLFVAQQKGDVSSQVEYARKLYAQDPNVRSALAFSSALAQVKQWDEAESVLQEQLSKEKTDLIVRGQLAMLYLHHGRYEEAIVQFRKIIEQNPKDMLALNNLAWLLRERSPQEALSFAKRAVDDNPRFSPILDTYATLLSLTGDHRSAVRVINDAIANANDPNPYRVRRAEILFRSGDKKAAVEDLELVLHSEPKPADAERAQQLLSSNNSTAR